MTKNRHFTTSSWGSKNDHSGSGVWVFGSPLEVVIVVVL